MNLEIERKFLIKDVPYNIGEISFTDLFQGYVIAGDEELRIRAICKNDEKKYFLTSKTNGNLLRKEKECEISWESFFILTDFCKNRSIQKKRGSFHYKNNIIEIDIYRSKELNGLKVAEVEFDSEQDASNFDPPDWFGEEVTNDERYKNKYLALNGLPK